MGNGSFGIMLMLLRVGGQLGSGAAIADMVVMRGETIKITIHSMKHIR